MFYDFEHEFSRINDVEQEVVQLFNQGNRIESEGLKPEDLKSLQMNKLLQGTALEYFIPEIFESSDFDDQEKSIALEALTTKIKDKMIEWSARILTFIKNLNNKILKATTELWEKLENNISSLINNSWDKAKSLEKEIKTHPYKTAAIVVGSIVAVAAIITFTGPAISTGKDALSNLILRLKAALEAFKSPLVKVGVEVSESGVLKASVENLTSIEMVSGNASKLSWSQTAVKLLFNKLKGAWRNIVSGVLTIGSKAINLVKWVNTTGGDGPKILGEQIAAKTGSKLLGWAVHKPLEKAYLTALWSVVGVIGLILYKIVTKSFLFLKQVFKPLEQFIKQE